MNIARHPLYPVKKAGIALSSIPEYISSNELPGKIARYARYHLRLAPPESTPDPSIPLINSPGSSSSTSTARRISIPNPFLLQKLHRNYEHLEPDKPRLYRYRVPIDKAIQKWLFTKHDRHLLPPSPLNPLPRVPIVRWEGKEAPGTEIVWEGKWSEDDIKPRGPYSNRKILFKGHKRDDLKIARLATIKQRMESMDARIEEWRQKKKDVVKAGRPSLPF